ncbi:hypothetical protein AN392_02435 [Pseudoalteromonas sp. P1-16-1b]|jgi:hypothetical protein|uniref:hypothetical protein n=1 Tax=unclassified Pseudoalteromonas TaxID=194690 RepID=UPI0006D67C7C|nr:MULTISPECIES: hypothetical protein [unclassified Pseudoalteromonas]KPZ64285.1 hypothetical protein AN392_02435 [Pseudoalteromonas sp. P1-16-1b]MBL0689955.1 hypothetical protein [Pseudoalteromonas sp.]TMP73720.1 hypothetical protein CWB75_13890 [Pseudoalteromonas sp. S1608]
MQNLHSTSSESQSTDSQSSAKHADDWQDHIAKLADYAAQLKDDYHQQGKLTHQLAIAEWKLSLRSLALITILLGCFASGLVLLWVGFLGIVGFATFDLFSSIWLSITVVISLQILCLIWLWRNAVYLSKKIGFTKTLNSLKQLLKL